MKMDSLEMMIDADSCYYFEERTMVLRDRINESFSMRHVPSRLERIDARGTRIPRSRESCISFFSGCPPPLES